MGNFIAILFVIAVVGGAIWKINKNKKSGKSSCGCSCAGSCGGNCSGCASSVICGSCKSDK